MDKLFIDYIGPLPRTKGGNRYVLVVVDAFSRFCWLVPSRGVTASLTMGHLLRIFTIFGPPKFLVSDNAPAFLSREFKKFCFDNGVKHITTTPYYPQPSFAERVNRNLKAALIAFHSDCQRKWDASLSWLNFAFNSATHEASKVTPASLMFTYPLNCPLSNLWSADDLLPEQVSTADIKNNWIKARNNIRRAHKRQEQRYNKGRRAWVPKVGEQVFIRNLDVKSNSGESRKLAPRFLGPCRVERILSPVNFLIRHPGSRKVTRAHVSQLKAAGGDSALGGEDEPCAAL